MLAALQILLLLDGRFKLEYIEYVYYKMDIKTLTEDDVLKILEYEQTLAQEEDMLDALPLYFSYFTSLTSPFNWRLTHYRSWSATTPGASFYLHSAFDDGVGVQIDLVSLCIGIDFTVDENNLVVDYLYYGDKIKQSIFTKELLDDILNPKDEGEDDNEEKASPDDGASS